LCRGARSLCSDSAGCVQELCRGARRRGGAKLCSDRAGGSVQELCAGVREALQRPRRGGACSCLRREPDASRRRSLRASPRTPGLRTVRLGGGGVSGSGRGEGACKITTAPRHEAEGRVGLRSGAASRTAVRRVIAFDRSIDRCDVARRLLSTCHQLTGNRHSRASATPAAPAQLRRRTCGLPSRRTLRLTLAPVVGVSGPFLPVLPPLLGRHATWTIGPGRSLLNARPCLRREGAMHRT